MGPVCRQYSRGGARLMLHNGQSSHRSCSSLDSGDRLLTALNSTSVTVPTHMGTLVSRTGGVTDHSPCFNAWSTVCCRRFPTMTLKICIDQRRPLDIAFWHTFQFFFPPCNLHSIGHGRHHDTCHRRASRQFSRPNRCRIDTNAGSAADLYSHHLPLES